MILTGYVGTVKNHEGLTRPVSYDNYFSAFARYEFPEKSPLDRLGFGGGLARMSGRWVAHSTLTKPLGWTESKPGLMEVKPGIDSTLFVSYRFIRGLKVRVVCSNVLDQQYAPNMQTAVNVEALRPRHFGLSFDYVF